MKADLRPWLLDPDRRECLLRSYRKDKEFDVSACILEEMNAHELWQSFPDLSHGLSRTGETEVFAAMEDLDADVIFIRQAFSHIQPAEKFMPRLPAVKEKRPRGY